MAHMVSVTVPTALSSVSVAIITRRRPTELGRLLERLATLYGDDPRVTVAVVDNDDAGSAAAPVDAARHRFAGELRYALQPVPGYASARNAAVALAGDADYLVFIDDDELPEAEWLERLQATARAHGADVVAGPVLTELPPDAPSAIVRSNVMNSQFGKQTEDGAAMPLCASGNTLVHRSVFERVEDGFDQRFDLPGGEDSHFFLRATQAGCKIVWCPTAVVRETSGPERAEPAWHVARARRIGQTRTMLDLELRRSPKTLAFRAAACAKALLAGLGLVVAGLARRDDAVVLRGRYQLGLARGMAEAILPSRRP